MTRTPDADTHRATLRLGCNRCRRQPRRGWSFAFRNTALTKSGPIDDRSINGGPIDDRSTGDVAKCFRCALLHPPMLRRSFLTALVVGSLLTALNQGNTLAAGNWQAEMFWKIPLTYCVPFSVATYVALSNARR